MHTMHTSIYTISQWSRKQDSLTVSPFTTVRPDVIKKVQRGIVTNRRSQSLKFLLTLLPSVLRSLARLITFMCTLISLLLHIYSKLKCPNISASEICSQSLSPKKILALIFIVPFKNIYSQYSKYTSPSQIDSAIFPIAPFFHKQLYMPLGLLHTQ